MLMYEMHSCIHTLPGGMTFKVSLKVKGLNTWMLRIVHGRLFHSMTVRGLKE